MNEDKSVQTESVSIDDAPVSDAPSTTDSEKQIAQLNAQIAELNDKYLRLAAELENTRRRSALDAESRARNRAMGIAEKILPVMDAVDAAVMHSPDDAGIKSMAMALESAFSQIGISRIKSVGEILNPAYHNAVQVTDASPDADPRPAPNTILSEIQAGYTYCDNILRPAMVIVSK